MLDTTVLRAIELFESLDDDTLAALLAGASERDLVRGDVIFEEGSAAQSMFIIESGRIAIGNKSFDGRESMVALLGHGDLFGEMSLFDQLGRSTEARALEPSVVIEIPYAPLREVWENDPTQLWRVVQLLTQRIRAMDHALADAFFLDVTGRTAKHLLELSSGEESFEIPITQEELAGMVGASRERVNKAISSFVKLGWIEQNERHYTILKRRELEIRSM